MWEKDLGVLVHEALKPSVHCTEAPKKGNIVLSQLSRGIGYMTKKVFIDLYKTRKLLTSMEYINSWGQRNVRSSSEESSEGSVKFEN